MDRIIYVTHAGPSPVHRDHLSHYVVMDHEVRLAAERKELKLWFSEHKLNRFDAKKKLGDWAIFTALILNDGPNARAFRERKTVMAFRDVRMAVIFKMRFT